jgi:hypothetical protein
MIERVRRDLVHGLKKPRKGRRGLTARQVLRSLVLMRVKNWDYQADVLVIAGSALRAEGEAVRRRLHARVPRTRDPAWPGFWMCSPRGRTGRTASPGCRTVVIRRPSARTAAQHIDMHVLPEWRVFNQAPRAPLEVPQVIADALESARGGNRADVVQPPPEDAIVRWRLPRLGGWPCA